MPLPFLIGPEYHVVWEISAMVGGVVVVYEDSRFLMAGSCAWRGSRSSRTASLQLQNLIGSDGLCGPSHWPGATVESRFA